MRVIITFLGLIAHLSLSSSNTSVLPVVPGHDPVLLILKSGCTAKVVPLTGKHVRVYGGELPFRSRLSNVPSLLEVAGCNSPLDDVDKLKKNTAVAAYVQIMDGGTLTSTSNHMRRIHFDSAGSSSLWSVPHCSSCRVEYRAKPTSEDGTLVLTVSDIEGTTVLDWIRIGPTDSVLVMNESGAGAADDYTRYTSLFEKCRPNAIPHEDAPTSCGTPPVCTSADRIPPRCADVFARDPKVRPYVKMLLVSPSVGCTNSQWP